MFVQVVTIKLSPKTQLTRRSLFLIEQITNSFRFNMLRASLGALVGVFRESANSPKRFIKFEFIPPTPRN